MSDPTENIRRELVEAINSSPATREAIEAAFGTCWDTEELQADYEVRGFMAPYVVVRRRADGQQGTLMFQHSPRVYFNFVPDEK